MNRRAHRFAALALGVATLICAGRDAGAQVWSATFAGIQPGSTPAIRPTADGGALVVGITPSPSGAGSDGLVTKLRPNGDMEWQRILGGSGDDELHAVTDAPLGGWVVVGTTRAGSVSATRRSDVWVVKLDSAGAVIWSRAIGGAGDEFGFGVTTVGAGNEYVIAGEIGARTANSDAWIVKIDDFGNFIWQKRHGGAGGDRALSIESIPAGGLVVAGQNASLPGTGNRAWVMDLNGLGNVVWQNVYNPGLGESVARSATPTPDGKRLVSGFFGSPTSAVAGGWVARLDGGGAVDWQWRLGSGGMDQLHSAWRAFDGGYVAAGRFGGGPMPAQSGLVKFDAGGLPLWQVTYGNEAFTSLAPTADAAFLVAGTAPAAATSGWALKVDANGHLACGCAIPTRIAASLTADPPVLAAPPIVTVTTAETMVAGPGLIASPVGVTAKTCFDTVQRTGWAEVTENGVTDTASAAAVTADGGYFVVGLHVGLGIDLWATRVDARGAVLWQQRLGQAGQETAEAVLATSDGGCIVAGRTASGGMGLDDGWVVKLKGDGTVQWEMAYGTPQFDSFKAIVPSASGYTLAGNIGGFFVGTRLISDVWSVRIDPLGGLLGQSRFGGAENDETRSLVATSDGGSLLAAYTDSWRAPDFDPWLIKLDAALGVIWAKRYVAPNSNVFNAVAQLTDGSYVATGESAITVSGPRGDLWLAHVDALGGIVWQRSYGDMNRHDFDSGYGIVATKAGGSMVAATTTSIAWPQQEVWALEFDPLGAILWQKAHPVAGTDAAVGVVATPEGGYFIPGYTNLSGFFDSLLMKLDADGRIGCNCAGQDTLANEFPIAAVPVNTSMTPAVASSSGATAATRTSLGGVTVICPAQ